MTSQIRFIFTVILFFIICYLKLETIRYYLLCICVFYSALCALDIILYRYHTRSFSPVKPDTSTYALITGATSGIGKDIAYQLGQKNYNLFIVGRNKNILEKMKKEIKEVHNVNVLSLELDLSQLNMIESLKEFLNKKENNHIYIDIVVNCAGFSMRGDFMGIPIDTIHSIIQVNLLAAVEISYYFLPKMLERKKGHILNISSLAGAAPQPGSIIYGATKSFLTNFTIGLNYELRHTGVTAACLLPGPSHTGFAQVSDLNDAILFNIPGFAMDSEDVAKLGINAMLEGIEEQLCGVVGHITYFLGRWFMPKRLLCLILAIIWDKKENIWKKL